MSSSSRNSTEMQPKFIGDILETQHSMASDKRLGKEHKSSSDKTTATDGNQAKAQVKAEQSVSDRTKVAKPTGALCLVCRKDCAGLARPCACPSKYMHAGCLVEATILNLDKPCAQCGQLYRGELILSRAVLNVHSDRSISRRNESVFRALLVSLTLAHLTLLINSPSTYGTKDLSTYLSDQIGQLLTAPLMIVVLSVLMYGLFQQYINRPISPLYFTDRARMVAFLDPKTRRPLHLYIRSLYGLLVEPHNGGHRWINKHVMDTKPGWVAHRLMVP